MLASILGIALAAQAAAPTTPPVPATQSVAPATSPALLPAAVQFDMTSKNTGRTYRIYISKPPGAPPGGGFPVLYVLDGDVTFGTASMEATLGRLEGRSALIVVGIGYYPGNPYLRRNPDLTPSMPTGATLANMEGSFGPVKPGEYGGAEGFHRFITEELWPIIVQSFGPTRKISR